MSQSTKPGGERMTSRERILAALRGDETDRFPIWLKMLGSDWRKAQPEPYRSLPADELLRRCGCDLVLGNGIACVAERPRVGTGIAGDGRQRATYYDTPDGELSGAERHDPQTASWHPVEYPVKSAKDLRALRWLFTDVRWRVDESSAAEARERQRQVASKGGATMTGIGPGPLMALMQHYAGPENTVFLMTDEPELFEETLGIMHQDRLAELRARLPHESADTFWLTENTSTSLISPQMFERYCMAHLRDYGSLIRERGLIAVHHMCGKLNALLEMIDRLPAQVNEAYTTRPVGDASLAEGRRRMPSKALMGGTNAALWLEPEERIVAEVAADVAACPDRRRIFLTSAGVLPPLVSFDKARRVVEELKRL